MKDQSGGYASVSHFISCKVNINGFLELGLKKSFQGGCLAPYGRDECGVSHQSRRNVMRRYLCNSRQYLFSLVCFLLNYSCHNDRK